MLSLQDNAWIDEAVEKIVKKWIWSVSGQGIRFPTRPKTVFMMTEAGKTRHFRRMTG